MKLLILIGNSAVGKMTVGQELCKITPFRLMHNHVAIEPVLEVFGSFYAPAIHRIREVIFEEFAASDSYGMIFTYMWAFDVPQDWEYIEHVKSIFAPYGTEFYYVELIAPQEIRLQRNRTANRLKHKASKRNVAFSEMLLLRDDANHRCVSNEGEIPFDNYLRIDNSALSAEDTARLIRDHFDL